MRAKRAIGIIWLAMLSSVAAPAVAMENLGCALSLIDQNLSGEVFAAYRANEDVSAPILKNVGDRLMACHADNHWNQGAIESAVRVMLGQMLADGLVPELLAAGVRPAAIQASIDSFLGGLAPADMRKFADGEQLDDLAPVLVSRLLSDNAVREDQLEEKVAFLIGEFAVARANTAFFKAAFAQQ